MLAIEKGSDAEGIRLAVHALPTLREALRLGADLAVDTISNVPPSR